MPGTLVRRAVAKATAPAFAYVTQGFVVQPPASRAIDSPRRTTGVIAHLSANPPMLLDFLPIVLFFVSYFVANADAEAAARFATEHLGAIVSGGVVVPDVAPVLLATVVVCAATLLQITALLVMRKKVHTLLWVTFVLVTVLGGLTVWFHNPTFIKWKPSAVCWAMAGVLLVSQMIGKNLLRTLVGKQLHLPDVVWQRLGFAWIAFLTLSGVANLYVAYTFSTSAWVSFKVFGLTTLNLLFIVAQGFYISRYLDDEDPAPSQPRVDKALPAESRPS
jgi:intracellular septation protein